jgi:polysaccharide export outer membrane protein
MGNRLRSTTAAAALFLFVQATTVFAQQSSVAVPVAQAIYIDAGDMIDITVFGQGDLSGHFRVNEKGEVLVPLIGLVHVAGMTADETAVDINQRYIKAEILNPGQEHVTVFISEYATQGILVTGEVKSPGLYPALGVRMLNDVLAVAGGLNQTAASKVVITHRNAPQNPTTVDVKPEANPPVVPQVQILPGDTLMVPRAGIVYLAGNVSRSGGYVLDGQRALTIEKLIALSGWAGGTASLDHTHLVRTLDDGSREDIQLSVNRIFKGKDPDIVLKDGDIVWIPTSRAKMITAQAISSALGIGTSIAIYRTQSNSF